MMWGSGAVAATSSCSIQPDRLRVGHADACATRRATNTPTNMQSSSRPSSQGSLHCRISSRLMSESGQKRRRPSAPVGSACPLLPKSGLTASLHRDVRFVPKRKLLPFLIAGNLG